MSETEVLKYQTIPSRQQLTAVTNYFKEFANTKGRVHFTQKHMFEHPIVAAYIKSPSFLNSVLSYLTTQGHIERIATGSRGLPSVWDVSKLLEASEKIPTREELGRTKPLASEMYPVPVPPYSIEVEVIRNETTSAHTGEKTEHKIAPKPAEPIQSTEVDNSAVLSELNEAMSDMLGYLQNLPAEMSGHLRGISDKLQLTDGKAIEKLKSQIEHLEEEKSSFEKEKMDLRKEVQRLSDELEEASSKYQYNTHQIYRQRNLIMDEVDRMISSPSWSIRQNAPALRKSIETKLDEIMKEIGIDIKN